MKLLQLLGIQPVETKDIQPWKTGASFQNGANFTTNQVTVADYMDARHSHYEMGLSATWACVNLIAGTIGSLSLEVYQKVNGVRVPFYSHPLYSVLHDDPNADLTSVDFWEYQAAAIELHGNCYAKINRIGARIVSLDPIPPLAVTVRRLPDGRLEYQWSDKGFGNKEDEANILHIRGPLATDLGGVSTLTACRKVFTGARSADSAASNMFERGALPSGVLSTEKALSAEQRGLAEKLLQEKFVGSVNAGRPMLLDNGVKWEQLALSPEDTQMLESRKFSGEEICRIFGVPPAMVGYGDKASNWGTGKEIDVLGFQKFTLRRRVKRIEKAIEKQLLSPADRARGIKVGFNFEDLLRADSVARAQFYNTLIRLGVMTRNEARALEGLPPIDGGDVVTVQMQDVPLAQATQGTENEN
jgi:HK97 family phage portal protein